MPVETRLRSVSGPATRAVRAAQAELVAIPVRSTSDGPLAQSAEFDRSVPGGIPAVLAHHNAKGEPGEIVSIPLTLDDTVVSLLCYGVGDLDPVGLRRAGAAVARRGKGRETLVLVPPDGVSSAGLAALAEGALLAGYTFRITAESSKASEAGRPAGKKASLRAIDVVADAGPEADAGAVAADVDVTGVLARVSTIVGAIALARDLTNTPSVDKSPAWLAERATKVAADGGLEIRVRTEGELRDEGFGGLLAVGSGAVRPPRFIEMSYRPGAANGSGGEGSGRHLVLVGKGITFDSGGLSLKPAGAMTMMNTDMAGGAAVIAVMSALARLGVPHRVTGLVAAAENLPSGSAMRPSDVVRHYGGRTSEVLNTDAEGRLVLADALAYADARLAPDAIVDIATLTGAAKVALGLRYAALYATDDALAAELLTASERSGERLWRMPLVDEYRAMLDSDVADLSNVERAGGGRGAGSITAALFLREFVGGRRWAHLDIAGPGRATSDDAELTKGATGYGVRLLLDWLRRDGDG